MVRGNNEVPTNKMRMRKDWQRYIKTHFDQPLKAKLRRRLRKQKAIRKAPRPLQKLRPIVRCATKRYNMRLRAGRGFSLLELKSAGLNANYARTIGIAVDLRRQNKNKEGLDRNTQRLKDYLSRLVLWPVAPKGAGQKDKEKMVDYFTGIEKAKQQLSQYSRYGKTPMPLQPASKRPEIVNVADIPLYDAVGTLKMEWNTAHKHAKMRRRNLKLIRRKNAIAAKKAKKAAKGK